MPSSDSAVRAAFGGALLGAFLTFVFLLIHDFYKSIKERRSLHLNSLVKLGLELNLDAETIHQNLDSIPVFIQSLEKPTPYLHKLITINLNEEHYLKLYNLELLNKLLTYQVHINKLNRDMSAIQSSYDELKSNLLSGGDEQLRLFIANAPVFIKWLKQIKVALQLQLEELDELAAEVRLHQRKDMSWIRKQKAKFNKNAEVSEEEIKAEIRLIQKERKDVGDVDKARVDKIRESKK